MTGNLKSLVQAASRHFTGERREVAATHLFIKALFLVALVRVIRLWLVSDVVFWNYNQSTPASFHAKVFMFPSIIAEYNLNVFFACAVIFLIIAMVLRPDYRINILFFVLILNVFRMKYPVTNGADFVLLVFSMLAVPLAAKPVIKWSYTEITSIALFNTFRILAQVQVLLIYLISGWDKLKSPMWRSGEAFDYIAHIDVMFNPFFTPALENSIVQWSMSWITILFELLFIPLVNIKRTRLMILCVGVVFHFVIWLMLGLPDFAWTMIATYPIFLKDQDLVILKKKLRLQPL